MSTATMELMEEDEEEEEDEEVEDMEEGSSTKAPASNQVLVEVEEGGAIQVQEDSAVVQ